MFYSQKMYAEEKVEFLLDHEESVEIYEEKGREKAAEEKRTASGTAMQQVLGGLDRYGQIEFATGSQ